MAARGARRGFAALVGTYTGCGVLEGFADVQKHDRVSYSTGYSSMDDYPDLTGCHSYAARVLSPQVWQVCWKMTSSGGQSFKDLIQPAVDCPSNPNSPSIGCYMGDEQGYITFANFIHEVIKIRHPGWDTNNRATVSLQPELLKIDPLPDDYVVACRIRGCRNFCGYRFAPTIRRGERREVETLVKLICQNIPGVFRGQYQSVDNMNPMEREDLQSAGLLFSKPQSPELISSGFSRDWPDGRGLYKSADQELMFWVNESDHLKIISQIRGGDMKRCFNKYAVACTNIEYQSRRNGKFFSHDSTMGYLGPSLANIGTAMRASLQVKLPLIAKHPKLPEYLEKHKIASTPLNAPGGIIELSNSERLTTETQLINNLVSCTQQLIAFERVLEEGKSIKYLK